MLFDSLGWWSPFALGALVLLASAVFAWAALSQVSRRERIGAKALSSQ